MQQLKDNNYNRFDDKPNQDQVMNLYLLTEKSKKKKQIIILVGASLCIVNSLWGKGFSTLFWLTPGNFIQQDVHGGDLLMD